MVVVECGVRRIRSSISKAPCAEPVPVLRAGAPRNFLLGAVPCSTHTIPELLAELRRLLADKSLEPRTILDVNAHIFNLACRDPHLRHCLNAARIVTADGIAIVWAARWLGEPVRERCNQTEAYHAFLADDQMPMSRAILIGASQPEAEAAASKACQASRHCQVVGAYSGFLSDGEYEKLLASHAEIDFIFLGMGTPRTEHVAELAARACARSIVWGIGAGTVKIEAGTMHEASPAWRRAGLQWLHRLINDPRALWRRYLFGNPLFLVRIAREKLKKTAKR